MKNPTEGAPVAPSTGPGDRPLLHIIIATGVGSVVGQLVFMREYQAQFQGNEMVLALVLFLWLVLGGLGTRLARVWGNPRLPGLVGLCLLLAGLSGVQLLLIRHLRRYLFGQGVSVGFYPILMFTLLTLAPYALLVGYLLPCTLKVIRSRNPDFSGVRAYLADNLGDVCGGALFAFGLIYWLTPVQALLVAHLPLVGLAWKAVALRGRWIPWVVVSVACLVLAMAGERPALTADHEQLLAYVESRYARLTIHRQAEQTTLFADGRPVAANQLPGLAEAAVHYPLSQIERTDRILLISIQGGMLREIQKYRPQSVDYVELDPAAAHLLMRFDIIQPMAGLKVLAMDGREWLGRTDRIYDAILVNLPEPDTLQLNRFFTDRFFQMARAHLHADGILSFQVEGFANSMTAPQRAKLACLRATAKGHFPYVHLVPGERIYFLCRQQPVDPDIPGRLTAKGISSPTIDAYYHGDITADRIEALERELKIPAPVNRDRHPYLMRVVQNQWFRKFGASPTLFIIVVVLVIGVYIFHQSREERVLFTSGWVVMGSEVLVLFAYQIFFGYIYVKLGVVVTLFLAGLLPGAWLGHRMVHRSGHLIPISEVLMILLMAGAAVLFHWGGDRIPTWIYYLWGVLISMVCGFQFPLALGLLGDHAASAVRLFSVDLVGAACGALVTGTLMVPYLGLVGAALLLMGLKLVSTVPLLGKSYARNP